MTKLTAELLEKFVSNIKTDGMCDITDHQVTFALRQLLAYEQAAKNSDLKTLVISEIVDFYSGFESPCEPETVDEAQRQLIGRIEKVFGLAAPVLPKQQPAEFKIGTSKNAWPYYVAQCPKCGWLGSSEDCLGDEESCDCPLCYAEAEETDAETAFNVMLDALNKLRASTAQPVSEPYKLPSGYALVPCKLTAENGAKSCMIGEFTEQTEISCPECFGDDECETCDGSGMIEVTVPVSWTTIKDIWVKGIEHFAAAADQEQK